MTIKEVGIKTSQPKEQKLRL